MRFSKLIALSAILPLALLTGGCNFVVLSPAGDIAAQQGNLIIISTVLMLLIIVPVMALTVLFAWRYRASNNEARYEPDWDHSTQLELVIWAAPLLIIICLGAITWMGTHLLDPYRSLGRIGAGKPVPEAVKPLEVQVVALDWKWLFIYPEEGIASVNELAAPVDRPIRFRITSASVMNSFYIPALAGQIYAMAGMETKLHGVINAPGVYKGFSANYSGAGFSGMRFAFHGMSEADYQAWVAKAKASGERLDRTLYRTLEKPSENVPAKLFGSVDPALYRAVLNMCVDPGKMCMAEMMEIDAKGGLGIAGINMTLPLTYDKYARRDAVLGDTPSFVPGICSVEELKTETAAPLEAPRNATPLVGVGLKRPAFSIPRPPAASLSIVRRPPSDS